ncbi:tetratricopeptide repeat protein [Paenibacillus sp. EC2-1]|uniref:tetratricopeptide repeat protein n=1 Tax=Paenibacillus sp. EC2-1 TaxID=3388665 RepID=UPI003BEED15E
MIDFDKLWDYNHADESERKFRRVLMEVQNTADLNYISELLTQIARALGLQRKFDEAHEILDQVESNLVDTKPKTQIRYLLERGRVLNSSARQEEALPLFVEAWELGGESGEDALAVDAAHMLGIAETTPELRMDWNMLALEYAEQHPNASRWLGALYNNIGWAQVEAGNLPEALDLFERALQFRQGQGREDLIFIAKWSIAKVLRLMKQTSRALEMQQLLLTEVEQGVEPDGYVYEEIGECLYALDRRVEASPYFSKAYELLSLDQWLTSNEPDRIARLKEL